MPVVAVESSIAEPPVNDMVVYSPATIRELFT